MSDGRRACERGGGGGDSGRRRAQPKGRAAEPGFLPRTSVPLGPTSRLIFSASSFLPLKAATHRRIFRIFVDLPDWTIQRMDSGIHLRARVRPQWLSPALQAPSRGWVKRSSQGQGVGGPET